MKPQLGNMPANQLRFLRQYGPVSQNNYTYDQMIQRSARKCRVIGGLYKGIIVC
jgi:hypothetical protein